MSTTRLNTPELTTEQVAKVLTIPLQTESRFLAAGPTIYDTTGPLRIPALGGSIADPGWTGETEQIPVRDVDFNDVSLLPSTMKSVKVISKFSNLMARSSVIALDAAIKRRLIFDVAAKLDAQFFGASGDGVTTPQGLFAYSGVQTTAVGGAITLDVLLDAWGKALTANANMSTLKWVMTPREFIKLRKIKDTNGNYLLTPDPTEDGVFRIWGSEVIVTPRVPDTTGGTPTARAALVDFGQIAVARDLAPSVTILRELYSETDEQGLRVIARYDAKPVNPQAIVTLTGIAI